LSKWRTVPPPLRAFLDAIDAVFKAPTTLPATLFGQPLSAYPGTYRNAYFGRFTIRQTRSALTLTAGPNQAPMPLRLVEGQLFVLNKSGDFFPLVFSDFDGAKFTTLTIADPTAVEIGWSVLTRAP
jgi:hypothetical protein